MVHDSSLIVSYHKSAAQVLKLIEELQYKLKSREQLIDKIRGYVETHGEFPEIFNIENNLSDVTCDQIATHFDSYYRFLEVAVPNMVDKEKFINICLDYANEYFKKYKFFPSIKAISLANKHNNLVMFSEADISDLVGDKIDVGNCSNSLEGLENGDVSESRR